MSADGLPTSPLRALIADSEGRQARVYKSWEEARSDPDSAIVISGDGGGTIYLTVPLRLIRCSDEALA
ncbi:hypothetical protein GCM10028798_15970 [Humibacter antri]